MLYKNSMEGMRRPARLVTGVALVAALLVQGCVQTPAAEEKAETGAVYLAENHLLRVTDLRKRYESDPGNIRLLMELREVEQKGVDFFLREGEGYAATGNWDKALENFEKGLMVNKNSRALLQAKEKLLSKRRARELLGQAKKNIAEGHYSSVREKLSEANNLDGTDTEIQALLQKTVEKLRQWRRQQYLVDLEFDNLEIKNALTFVAKTYGINLVFDNSVKDTSVSFDIKGIAFVDAIELLTKTTRNNYKVLNKDTLLIFSDTKDYRKRYDEIAIKTFGLQTLQAKDMAAILKSVLGLKNLTVNESSNALIVRDNQDMLALAEKVVRANDVSPGEVVLDVEILEINLTKTERLGIDYGNYQISTATPAVSAAGSIQNSIANATTLNIPTISLNAFKQAVDAKSLAQPSIRVLDGKKAKIHIGDRVPLRKSSIQDATGQTRTTFEYQEIGIRFNVEASIHSNDRVTVNLELEVSTLGENLGTATEQAFRIGTRNAATTMLVSSGETAILGGLFREEERSTTSGISGLGNISHLKRIFGSDDLSDGRTDLLLTITPYIIRRAKNADAGLEHVAAGTEDDMRHNPGESELDRLNLKKPDTTEAVVVGERKKLSAVITSSDNRIKDAPAEPEPESRENDTDSLPPVNPPEVSVSFSQPQYAGSVGEVQHVVLGLDPGSNPGLLEFAIGFNPNIIQFLEFKLLADGLRVVESDTKEEGNLVLRLEVVDSSAPGADITELLNLTFNLKRRGTSFLAPRVRNFSDIDGAAVEFNAVSSKVIVR